MKRIFACLAIGALATLSSRAMAANLIANPGFEDPLTSDGYPFVGSWEAFNGGGGSSATNSSASPRSGAMNADLTISGVANTFAGIFQDVPNLVPGSSFTLSGYERTPSNPLDLTVEVRIEWRTNTNNDATSTEVSRTPNMNDVPTSAYQPFSLTANVPAGASVARVVYAIQTFSGGPTHTGTVYLDDFSATGVQTPEPATFTIAGLGLAGLFALGRRKRA